MTIIECLDDTVHARELLLVEAAKLPEVEYALQTVYIDVEKCAQRMCGVTKEVSIFLAEKETIG